jgi:hypothetical protein
VPLHVWFRFFATFDTYRPNSPRIDQLTAWWLYLSFKGSRACVIRVHRCWAEVERLTSGIGAGLWRATIERAYANRDREREPLLVDGIDGEFGLLYRK